MDGIRDRDDIEATYRRLYRGMIDKDRQILEEILSDSFVLIHMTGLRQSKETFIRAVENGTLNYFSATHQRIEISIHDDKAVLTGQSLVSAAVFGGGRHTWRLQLDVQMVRSEEGWKSTEARASTY